MWAYRTNSTNSGQVKPNPGKFRQITAIPNLMKSGYIETIWKNPVKSEQIQAKLDKSSLSKRQRCVALLEFYFSNSVINANRASMTANHYAGIYVMPVRDMIGIDVGTLAR
ncbi:hypothetical protein V1477_008152 [Vespula maculifrons]|uniref:Uncharacterized protein n=1 Tax=Vespula maculifrons TaxID=7453 RepID=A0ABD2CC71_VESMC